ncbi:MAG: sigma-70 family RNA polymerase sigma factor [Myxococcales bacterium]|nr:sigma-70 family RNA polymerase sigma factor [Myxococcota bacterium]MDW8283352.1 sigma-70 family RNA polymerase sigma factor [Myxococcales bacterium]
MNRETVGGTPLCGGDTRRPPRDEDLVLQFLPLIRKIAGSLMRRLPAHIRIDDLEAAGIVGLLHAAQLRDPERPEQFEAYARRRIEGSMLDELRKSDTLPKDARQLSRRIIAAMRAVEQREGHIDEELVAEELGVSLEEYRSMLERTVDVRLLSLDHPTDEHGRQQVLQVPTGQPTALEAMLEAERCMRVAAALRRLPDKQRKVLALYYLEELSMKEIALTLNLTVPRVCQLHSEGVHAVRSMLEAEEEVH